MQFIPLSISGVVKVIPKIFGDARGFFCETYHIDTFNNAGITLPFVQDNYSVSEHGTLRGLHAQLSPYAQGKLVRVTEGEIYDVAVDIRPQSPTFKQWVAERLSSDNQHQLYIPPGCAHGFYVLSRQAHVSYKCTQIYRPEYERSICWNDPDIGIEWPIPDGQSIRLSDKDRAAPTLYDIL